MNIVQLAYYVPDAQAAALEWAAQRGAGPFFYAEHIELHNVTYRVAGKDVAAQLDHSSAYGWCGQHMVELVQYHPIEDGQPSVFSDHPWGLHHCAYFAGDLDVELTRLADLGYTAAMRAETHSGVRFAFVRYPATGPAPLGHYLEIYQDGEQLRSFYERVEAASQGWDGRDPVR